MRSIFGCCGLLAIASIWSAACGDTTAGNLFPGDAGFSALPALGGRDGRGGLPGRSGAGGSAGTPDAGPEDAPADSAPPCSSDEECADGNECTIDRCELGACVQELAGAGSECGSALDGECTHADSCDGAGACLPNDESDGVACTGGVCGAGQCVLAQEPTSDCPAATVAELPFSASWRTVGGVDLYRGTCDINGTPDFAVVFTAPLTAVYRFDAAGVVGDNDPEGDPESELADSVLMIAAGSCAGVGAEQLGCNDDANDQAFDSRIDLRLEAGQTVTVYVNEFQEVLPGGGSGTLSIRQLSNDD